MNKLALFIQGAGRGAYEEDEKLVVRLRHLLGPEYNIRYPAMPDEGDADYEAWKQQIEKELAASQVPVVLIGHSVGGSILIKCLSELGVDRRVVGILLIAAPFWGGGGWLYEGYEKLALPKNFATKFPKDARMYLYHSRDDEIVPFEHLGLYAQEFPHAIVREFDEGGHQLNNDWPEVVKDIKVCTESRT